MIPLFNPSCRIDSIELAPGLSILMDVLRLDLIDPVVSGNKWFKLNYYLEEAVKSGKTILTFGGAHSNHIVATAAAARKVGLKSIGIIRGERPLVLSPTLVQATELGMELLFSSRNDYKEKRIPETITSSEKNLYIIPEGGRGHLGMLGAKEILLQNKTATYTHILSAVGTGTTLAGLAAASTDSQHVIGISVLKNYFSLGSEVDELLPADKKNNVSILHDYHFGGYAKRKEDLIRFMNNFFRETAIPTDFVYTGKMVYAAMDLARKQFFLPDSKILLVHTGGLQGNRSLPKGTLIFG
ncbi:pyridoxal-phosphate dependent enzyme [Flavisolibacter sp. BT320]|nr:pyridoxal-phosphate dependent enzyme [Flavisolibacter longurius]